MPLDFAKLDTYGKRLVVETTGPTLKPEEAALLEELKPAGVVFRARNFNFRAPYERWLQDYEKLVTDIKAAIGRKELIVAIDHEGGRVIRPPAPITRFPYARKWGSKVAEVAEAMVVELKSLGINMSFSPVVDIDDGCKVIGQRAFSSDVDEVTKKASIFAEVFIKSRMQLSLKHYPGHGAVRDDSHYKLPISDATIQKLKEHEFKPFKELIAKGANAVMTAHIIFPNIDPTQPATFSKTFLVDLLRKEMNFDGLIIADALGMKAVSDTFKEESTTLAGLKATLDLFLIVGDSVNLNDAKALALEMQKLVQNGDFPEEEFAQSLKRIDAALSSAADHQIHALDQATFTRHAELAKELDPSNEWENFQYIPQGF